MPVASAFALVVLSLAYCDTYDYEYAEGQDNNYSNYYEDTVTIVNGGNTGRVRRFGGVTVHTLEPREIDDVKGAIAQILSGHGVNPFNSELLVRTTEGRYTVFTRMPMYHTEDLDLLNQAASYKFDNDNSITEALKPEKVSEREEDKTKWIFGLNKTPERSNFQPPSRSTIHAPRRSTILEKPTYPASPEKLLNQMTYIPERPIMHTPKRSTLIIPRRSEPSSSWIPDQVPHDSIIRAGSHFKPDESLIHDTYVQSGSLESKSLPDGSMTNELSPSAEQVGTLRADGSLNSETESTLAPDGSMSYDPSSTYGTGSSTTEEWIWTQDYNMTSTTFGLNMETEMFQMSPFGNEKGNRDEGQRNPGDTKGYVHVNTEFDRNKIPYDSLRQGDDSTTTTTTTTAAAASTTTTTTTITTTTTTETTTTTTTQTTTTTTPAPRYDIDKFLEIIANITYDYETDLVAKINASLKLWSYPTCGPLARTTTESWEYGLNQSIVAKCFVCGLDTPGIPLEASCADAFAGDFLPLVPQDPRAKAKIARFRKYCRYGDFNNYWYNASQPRTMYGRWTGGCSVRWTDLSGVYTQRACRNRRRAVTGLHYGSKRMAKLEMALKKVDAGCIVSPMATLLPLSRGISLFARFHACVCVGNWCNAAVWERPNPPQLLAALWLVLVAWYQ